MMVDLGLRAACCRFGRDSLLSGAALYRVPGLPGSQQAAPKRQQAARSPRDFVPAGMRGLRFFIFGGKKTAAQQRC